MAKHKSLLIDMIDSGLYRYRVQLYNEWKDSGECVTMEFETWLVDRLKRKEDALEFAKKAIKRLKLERDNLKQ
jgi:hypothetical protein